jgi:hypothetical protein
VDHPADAAAGPRTAPVGHGRPADADRGRDRRRRLRGGRPQTRSLSAPLHRNTPAAGVWEMPEPEAVIFQHPCARTRPTARSSRAGCSALCTTTMVWPRRAGAALRSQRGLGLPAPESGAHASPCWSASGRSSASSATSVASLVYGLEARDPVTLVGAVLTLGRSAAGCRAACAANRSGVDVTLRMTPDIPMRIETTSIAAGMAGRP